MQSAEYLRKGREAQEARIAAMTPAERNAYYSEISRKGTQRLKSNQTSIMAEAQVLTLHAPVENISEAVADANKATRTNIFWSPSETKTVAYYTAQALLKMNVGIVPEKGDRHGTQLMLDCIRQAQVDHLPRERRRLAVNSRNAFKEMFWDFVEREMKEQRAAKKTESVTGIATPPPAASAPAPIQHATTAPAIAHKATPSAFEEMIEERIRAITTPLENFVIEEIARLEQTIDDLKLQLARGSHTSAYMAPEKPKAPIVAIFGCRKDQFDFVVKGAEEAGLKLDLRHYDQDAQGVTLVAEWAIHMRWQQHANWERMKKLGLPQERIAFVRGGITSVVDQLKAWFKNE
jgi:hypothetical protein